jgi:hypothetical protein
MHEHVTAILVAHEELDPRVVGVPVRFGDSDHDWPLTGGSEDLDDRLEALARMLLEVLVDVSDLAPETVPIERHSSAERNRWSSHEPRRESSTGLLTLPFEFSCSEHRAVDRDDLEVGHRAMLDVKHGGA